MQTSPETSRRRPQRARRVHALAAAGGGTPARLKCRQWVAWGLLLPMLLIMTMAFVCLIPEMGRGNATSSSPLLCALLGVTAFAALVVIKLPRDAFNFIYTLGHEATHAVAVWLCLGKVLEFRVTSRNGGHITSDKANLFISLSPYFVPFWMLVWMLLLALLNACAPLAGYEFWYYGGAGFWWAFHLYWTFRVIPREQSDLLKNGYVFSAMIVLMSNIAVLVLICLSFGLITLSGYLAELKHCAAMLVGVLRLLWQIISPGS